MSAAANDSRKRSKKRYVGPQNKRWKGPRELDVGMQGILITCNMNQRKCTAEAFDLLNEYADELYGPEKLLGNRSGGEEEELGEEEDVDVALRKEVAQLQAPGPDHQKRFQSLESGANNVIFIKTQNLEPDKLVHRILSDLHSTKKKKSRMILRMLPVTGTCRAFQEDMLKFLKVFLKPWFKIPHCASYQIAFKSRNNSHNKREEIIKSIAGVVGKLNHKNKVDLTNPELTIIVEVIKAVCCFSVVKDYTLYRKYNLQEVVKEDTPKPEGNTEKVDSNTVQEEEVSKEEVMVNKEQEDEKGSKEEDVNKEQEEEKGSKEEVMVNKEQEEEKGSKEEEVNKEQEEEKGSKEEVMVNKEQEEEKGSKEEVNKEQKEEKGSKEEEVNKEDEETTKEQEEENREKDCDKNIPEDEGVDEGEGDGE